MLFSSAQTEKWGTCKYHRFPLTSRLFSNRSPAQNFPVGAVGPIYFYLLRRQTCCAFESLVVIFGVRGRASCRQLPRWEKSAGLENQPRGRAVKKIATNVRETGRPRLRGVKDRRVCSAGALEKPSGGWVAVAAASLCRGDLTATSALITGVRLKDTVEPTFQTWVVSQKLLFIKKSK